MKRSLAIAISTAILAAPGAALAQPQPERTCLESSRIRDFDPQSDNRTIIVTDAMRKKYKVRLEYPCLELKWRTTLGFESLGGSQLACLGQGDRVIARGHGFPGDRCLIQSVTAYTPDMERADRAAKAMDRPH